MAHCISTIILRGPFDAAKAAEFNLQPVPLTPDLTLFPLTDIYCDDWTTDSREGFLSERPVLNSFAVHRIINSIANQPLFAIIETEYFGGDGDQAAAVYQGHNQIMPPTVADFG